MEVVPKVACFVVERSILQASSTHPSIVDCLLLVKLVYALVDMFLQTFCADSTQDRAAKVPYM